MKTILITLVSVILSLGAPAQRKSYYRAYHPHPRVYISPYSYSLGFGYPGFGYSYFGYPVYGYPYYGYPYSYGHPYFEGRRMPYKLSLEIESIKADYRNKIRETRKDKSLSHSQRRHEIRSLKAERDQEIINAERNFRRGGKMNNQYRGNEQ